MTELRHLLGVLTPGPADDLLHPQPGLDQLEVLIDNVRRAGQPVSARRTPAALPHGMDLTAYRVVQEALTNTLRHAHGAHTEVTITTKPSAGQPSEPGGTDLVIEVTNDAPPPGTASGPATGAGAGSGLLGLTERLRLYGGTLETGRRTGGGFHLRARMPLDAGPARHGPVVPR
jgi:signal transduction histidine kinase